MRPRKIIAIYSNPADLAWRIKYVLPDRMYVRIATCKTFESLAVPADLHLIVCQGEAAYSEHNAAPPKAAARLVWDIDKPGNTMTALVEAIKKAMVKKRGPKPKVLRSPTTGLWGVKRAGGSTRFVYGRFEDALQAVRMKEAA